MGRTYNFQKFFSVYQPNKLEFIYSNFCQFFVAPLNLGIFYDYFSAAKEVKKTTKATTKKAPAAGAAKAAKPKAAAKAQKVNMKAAPKVGGKR